MRAPFVRRDRFFFGHVFRLFSSLKRVVRSTVIGVLTLLTCSAVAAQQTTTYTYDALGRLIVANQGTTGPNANVVANYAYDAAGNRCNVTVSTSGAVGYGSCSGVGGGQVCGGVSFSIGSNGAVTEGTNSVFTITKTGATSDSCSVNYATANGTATAGSDYTAKSGTLTFTAAQTSLTVSVPTTVDHILESSETFTMTLSAPSGNSALGSPSSVTATINDNPATVAQFSINDTYASEGQTMTFTVTKAGTSPLTYTMNFATANGTATLFDYNAKSGTLTFGPTDTSKTITVSTLQDTNTEDDETVFVNLSNVSGYGLITDAQGRGFIIDDDDLGPCGPLLTASTDPAPGDEVVQEMSTTQDPIVMMQPVCP